MAETYLGFLDSAYAMAGNTREARELLAELQERSKPEYVPVRYRSWSLAALERPS